MTRRELVDAWVKRAYDFKRFEAHVDGALLIEQLIADLEALFRLEDEELLTLSEAAAACGYSQDHIGRLVRSGELKNYGRPHRPRVRRADLPRKAGQLPQESGVVDIQPSKRQIARSVANQDIGRRDDG